MIDAVSQKGRGGHFRNAPKDRKSSGLFRDGGFTSSIVDCDGDSRQSR
jgi:hypothetical protein